MKIIIFSINPIFPKLVTGGASKHLYHIARQLGAEGHHVEVLCSSPEESLAPFKWAENVSVSPILPFHLPFPQPYAVVGADLALIVERVAKRLADADRFYIHDGEFLLPDVYAHVPTIISFRDNIYPESVLGSFIGKFDEVICVSPYSADIIRHTVGRFYPDLHNRLHQINNGIDTSVFKPVDPSGLAAELGIDHHQQTILLHPHRPELGKGLPETIQLIHRLVTQAGFDNLKVLVPEWIGSMTSPDDSRFYAEMMRLMENLHVRDYFQFIPWLPPEKMPAFYSLGAVTLCLGNIVEAFGNVAYESLACGTPSVVASVGVHRTLLPDELIAKVPYGDIDAAVSRVTQIVQGGQKVGEETMLYLQENLNFRQQVESYAQVITQCQKREPVSFIWSERPENQRYQLAPWCYLKDDQIYHDFQGRFLTESALTNLLRQEEIVTKPTAFKHGVSPLVWENWLDQTYLVPLDVV